MRACTLLLACILAIYLFKAFAATNQPLWLDGDLVDGHMLCGHANGSVTDCGHQSSQSIYNIDYQPGLVTSILTTKNAFYKVQYASTLDNIEAYATVFTCVGNPTINIYECGTSKSCSSPTIIGSAVITASGSVVDGTISNNGAINAGDYVAFGFSGGTCVSLNAVITGQIRVN